MADTETMDIIDNLVADGKSWIEVVGPDAEHKAKLIANYYDTSCYGTVIVANDAIDREICTSEEDLITACENMSASLGISICADDFEF